MNDDYEINNNCFGHSQNPGTIMHRNFRHRSLVETFITESLYQRQFLFAPMPVFTNGSRRIELDFLIIKDGVAVGLEQGAAIKKVGADFTGQLLDQLGNETEAVVEKIEATVLEGSKGLTSMIKQSGSVPAGFDLTTATPLPIEPNEE